MKTIPAPLAAHYALGATTLCKCLRITRRDATIFGLTTLDEAITVSAVEYGPGLEANALESSAGLAVTNTRLTIVQPDQSMQADLEAGLWDNADFSIFEVNYAAPTDGINQGPTGTLGEVEIGQGSYGFELRGLTQALQQTVGLTTQRTCRANFADYPRQALASRCGLVAATWTVTGTITGATSRQIATDSARAEAADYFGGGFLRITAGLNVGHERQIKAFTAGQFTFQLPFPFDIETGDAYSAIAGCRKRHDVDCATKFSNILNFQGEPHLPGIDAITKVPGVGT